MGVSGSKVDKVTGLFVFKDIREFRGDQGNPESPSIILCEDQDLR